MITILTSKSYICLIFIECIVQICLYVLVFFFWLEEGCEGGGVQRTSKKQSIKFPSLILSIHLPGLNNKPSLLVCLLCFDFFDDIQQDPFIPSRLSFSPCWTLKDSDSYITVFLDLKMCRGHYLVYYTD